MKKIILPLFTVFIFILGHSIYAQNVGIGTLNPNPSAKLDVSAINGGVLLPRLTGTQRDAIQNPAAGLIIYCTNCSGERGQMQYFDGVGWRSMNTGAAADPSRITLLDCDNVVNIGILVEGNQPSGVNSTIPYTGGNGGSFPQQSVNSTGVLGLTATLLADTLENGSGMLTFLITGTPTTSGTAKFTINFLGERCTLSRDVNSMPANPGTVTDASGNIYPTVVIGTQVWMAENLRTEKYRNGTPIPNVTDNISWRNSITGAWSFYNNSSANNSTYGKIYNWYAVNDINQICPTGWHVPTDTEWATLTTFLGGLSVAGGKMKTTGTTNWQSPNATATNSSGFSGLPGGIRSTSGNGLFTNIGTNGYWWSSTIVSVSAWFRNLFYNDGSVVRNSYSRSVGMSVRCIAD